LELHGAVHREFWHDHRQLLDHADIQQVVPVMPGTIACQQRSCASIRHSCGHDGVWWLYGSDKETAATFAALRAEPCQECLWEDPAVWLEHNQRFVDRAEPASSEDERRMGWSA
jgi:hypothetical protein